MKYRDFKVENTHHKAEQDIQMEPISYLIEFSNGNTVRSVLPGV